MTKLFLDTNVVMDMLLRREPFFLESANIFALAAKGEARLFASSLTYATAAYLIGKRNMSLVRPSLQRLRRLSHVTRIDERIVDDSFASDFEDFEDALQYFSATTENIDYIITRNAKDFLHASIPVLTPTEFMEHYSA